MVLLSPPPASHEQPRQHRDHGQTQHDACKYDRTALNSQEAQALDTHIRKAIPF